MAITEGQQKFERRMRRAEKTLAEARWDNVSKMWRKGIVDGLKLFPAITQGNGTQGKKATCKTDKDSSKPKETKRSWIEEDDSDNEEFINQLLHDRPPHYAVDDNAPSSSAGPGDQTQEKGVTDKVQTSDTGLIQKGVSVPTAPDMQLQLQPPPQIQRIYPDVPVLETTTNLIVLPDPIYTKSRLVQIEPTPQLLPQPQQQLIPGYSPAARPPFVPAPASVSQTLGVTAQRGLGPGQTPAAISLPMTVGPPVPLCAQGKPGMCDQGVMTQDAIRGGSIGTPQLMAPGEQSVGLVETPLEAMRQAGLGVLTPQNNKYESVTVINDACREYFTERFYGATFERVLEKTHASQTTAVTAEKSERDEYLHFVRLGVEAAELVEGTIGVNILESYTEAELRYLCPKITKELGKVHQRLANLADKYNTEIENSKHLKRSYRLDFDSKDFDHMRSAGIQVHLKEILQSAQIWGALEKWEDVYPRLREKPIEWCQQTDRFVNLAKCLWEDLNTLFEINVPPNLWLECKRVVDWPTQEPARDKVTGAPSEEVMKYYYKVIEFLKQKVLTKVTDWQKIDRSSQEVKESIHAYYERLLKAFKHYSGTETIEQKDMNHLVFRFVEGLRPEVSQMIKNHLICWQAEPIDEVLQYAKYCSDGIELKQRKLKEKVM
ncbi:hypothetical protein NDU88_002346 [Pleurodeles waltl]|uniref:Uncharacterized protein n=1 Tax=Pleurodeles waltl TaxID=8319 RepID=A0AAV7VDG4_PLEWA|nr:hypothetical protein NDU88_002346 [Pleurodeles waltl]